MAGIFLGVALTTTILSVSFVSCKPVNPNEELQKNALPVPLNSKQISEFHDFINAVGRIHSASLEAKNIADGVSVSDPFTEELATALVKSGCDISYQKAPSATNGARHSFLNVNGPKCPITVSFESNYKNGKKGIYSMVAAFSVDDAETKRRNDVYDLALSGRGTFELSENSTREDFESSVSGAVRTVSKGTVQVHSQYTSHSHESDGKLTVEGQRSLSLHFPSTGDRKNFRIDLKARISIIAGKDSTTYSMNGLEISAQEFSGYLSQFGLAFF